MIQHVVFRQNATITYTYKLIFFQLSYFLRTNNKLDIITSRIVNKLTKLIIKNKANCSDFVYCCKQITFFWQLRSYAIFHIYRDVKRSILIVISYIYMMHAEVTHGIIWDRRLYSVTLSAKIFGNAPEKLLKSIHIHIIDMLARFGNCIIVSYIILIHYDVISYFF